MEKAIEGILIQRLKDNSHSIFPYSYYIKTKEVHPSRLAWCYGDLGIALALLQAGKITKNQNWVEEAIKVSIHASRRRELYLNGINDPCFCHGTIGVAHIFNRLYHYTGLTEFREAACYWYLQTLDFFEKRGHLKMRTNVEGKSGWLDEPSILEGSAGVGLSLISAISGIEPKWDRCLLLS